MMKTTLIKDLYGEIELLKAEVYATREKNGVYIPKERYYQEESERKAMVEKIEQMGLAFESHQKNYEELQNRYDDQVRQCCDLRNKLECTEKTLDHTANLLSNTEEDLVRCRYTLKEKNFVIIEQNKAENALTIQACTLRSDLEKALQDNASLFLKIGREDKLCADNRLVVNTYQEDLAKQVGSLCQMVETSTSNQNEHLQGVENLCLSFLLAHEKAVTEMKKKVASSSALYASHIEAVQNVVRFHKENSNAGLDEISSLATANAHSIKEFLATEASESASIFQNLLSGLSTQQGETASFAKELKQKFQHCLNQTKEISKYSQGLLQKFDEESRRFEVHVTNANDIQMKSITEFQKAYDEQSRSDAQKLIANISSLVTDHIYRQKEMVDAKLFDFRESAIADKCFLDGHVSTLDGISTDAKRKWMEFSTEAENDAKDGVDYSAAKHCRMEVLLEQCVSTANSAANHWKKTQDSVNDIENNHVSAMETLIRNANDSNEQHDAEINTARNAVGRAVAKDSEDALQLVESMDEQERESISGILEIVKVQSTALNTFKKYHTGQATSIEDRAHDAFQNQYMDYEPTGSTPEKAEVEAPSKGAIESLRAMPMEALVEEFRENNSYESFEVKELKPSLIPRSPLTPLN